MPAAHEFKRVLFGLHQRAVDRASIDLAAELAALLGLDMLGLYLQEPHLARLAELPFAREFDLPARTWRPIDVERYAREYEASAFAARQLFVATAATRGVTCEFEIASAGAAQAIHSFSHSSDIVVVAEPMGAADRVVGLYPEFAASAIRSEGAVLMLPPRVARKHGAIVAIARTSGDPSIDVARSIAAAANERLIVLVSDKSQAGQAGAAAGETGPGQFEKISLPASAFASVQALSAILDQLGERMIVLTRGTLGAGDETILKDLGALRRIPVLILEPKAVPT
jgi:hypothetical protein